ncbi:MAG: STAS domain-containing protein [Veillonellaceae bacterium]|nr:STAS domain-containing protein [Veillonellaceae bacterium]
MQLMEQGGIRLITLPQRVDVTSAPELEKLCNDLINNGCFKIVCDFSHTEYVSSSGLRVFLSGLKRTVKAGGGLSLCCLNPGIMEIFEMTGLADLFGVHASSTEAVAALSGDLASANAGSTEKEPEPATQIPIEKSIKDIARAYSTPIRPTVMDEKA